MTNSEELEQRANDVTVALTEALLEELPLDEDGDEAGLSRWGERADKLIAAALKVIGSEVEGLTELLSYALPYVKLAEQNGSQLAGDLRSTINATLARTNKVPPTA